MRRFYDRSRKQILLVLLLSGAMTYVQAQPKYLQDSITITGLAKQTKDSIELNPDHALTTANEILRIAAKNDYKQGFVIANNLLGWIYQRKSDVPTAVKYYNTSIELARAGNFKRDLSISLYNLAGLYGQIGSYEQSFECVNESLEIRQKLGDSAGIAKCYRQLAECMFFKKDFQKANSYSEKSIAILRKADNPSSLTAALSSYGVILMEQKKYKEALVPLLEMRDIAAAYKLDNRTDELGTNLGLCFHYLNQTDSAFYYYNMGLEFALENAGDIQQSILYNNIGELYFQQNNIEKAKYNYLKARELAISAYSLEDMRAAQKNLAVLFEKQGDFKEALKYSKEYQETTDSLSNEQKIQAIEDVSVKYETKQIDEQNKILQSENTIVKLKNKQKNYYLLAIIAGTFVIGAFVWIYFKRKQTAAKNKTNALRQKLLLSQMNPHFIFNSIDNIQSLIYNKKDETAIMYLTKFSRLTRQILENATEDHIALNEEIAMLENYIDIQKLLYGDHFNYRITADGINTEAILVPPMLAQPFVENAIKHGLKDKKEGGMIEIRFFMNDGKLFFEITDNGEGIKVSPANMQHRSMANNIVRERLKQKSGTILTKNRTDENNQVTGAIASFEMPYVYNN